MLEYGTKENYTQTNHQTESTKLKTAEALGSDDEISVRINLTLLKCGSVSPKQKTKKFNSLMVSVLLQQNEIQWVGITRQEKAGYNQMDYSQIRTKLQIGRISTEDIRLSNFQLIS